MKNNPESFSQYMGRWANRITEVYKFFYEEGYARGIKDTHAEIEKANDGVAFVDVATDDQRKAYYCDKDELFGFCSKCGKALTGKWAGFAEFCPHCGRKFSEKRFTEEVERCG